MYPPSLREQKELREPLLKFMLNACVVTDAFNKDVFATDSLPWSFINLYQDLCGASGYNPNEQHHIEYLKECMSFLHQNPDIKRKWITIRTAMQTVVPKTVRKNLCMHKRNGLLFLSPPVSSCMFCDKALGIAKHQKEQLCYTTHGVITAVSISYRCRNCDEQETLGQIPYFHYDQYSIGSTRHHYKGDVVGPHRTSVFSQHLNESVSIPDYIHIGLKWYSWDFMKFVAVQSSLGQNSYSKTADVLSQTVNQCNLNTEPTADSILDNHGHDRRQLQRAHFWWRMFQVQCLNCSLCPTTRSQLGWNSSARNR